MAVGRRITPLDLGEVPGGNRQNMLRFAVRKAVENELTDRQKEAVMLCFYGDKSVSRAAEELGLNKSTVSRHLKRARQKIERSLQYGFFPIWRDDDTMM
jgi:DNA-directed RNA polymerase specialized sigma24 family protein